MYRWRLYILAMRIIPAGIGACPRRPRQSSIFTDLTSGSICAMIFNPLAVDIRLLAGG